MRILYTLDIEPEMVFNRSVFKHGVTEADIRWAFKTRVCDKLIAGYEDKYAVVEFDVAGNPLEVMYNQIDDETINERFY